MVSGRVGGLQIATEVPMLILDRYLLRQFVQIFLICFISLVGLYIVIDLFGNIDDFLRKAGTHGKLWAIIGEYYAYRSIGFFNQTSGILALIAAMFTVALFQRYNELDGATGGRNCQMAHHPLGGGRRGRHVCPGRGES